MALQDDSKSTMAEVMNLLEAEPSSAGGPSIVADIPSLREQLAVLASRPAKPKRPSGCN